MKKLLLLGVFLVNAIVAQGQIFPEKRLLDVIVLVDGSVLRGEIVETGDDILKIAIYGGSVFVVDRANIDRIGQAENPDYGVEWTTVRVQPDTPRRDEAEEPAREAPPPEEPTREEPAREEPAPIDSSRVARPHLGNGHILGLYFSASEVDYRGYEFESDRDRYMAGARQRTSESVGISYTLLRQARPAEGSWWMWGFRTGLGFANKFYRADLDDPPGADGSDTGNNVVQWDLEAQVLEIPLELLIGGGGHRLVAYVGVGGGFTVLRTDPSSEFDGVATSWPAGESANTPVTSFVRFSGGMLLRLGERWTADLRVAWDNQLVGWYSGYSMNYQSIGIGVGAGYHFGR